MDKTADTAPTRLQQAIEDWLAADPARSGRQLNAAAGLSEGHISRIRKDGTNDIATVEKLAAALGKPVWWLLGLDVPSAAAPGDIELVPLDRIQTGTGLNPRKSFADEAIRTLADDIFAHGLMQPLVARETRMDYVELIAGERRLRAICLLVGEGRWSQGTRVPCKIVKADDTRAVAMALAENIQREQLDPIDEAQAFHNLIQADPELWDTASIGALIHKTPEYVQQRLRLLRLDEADQRAVKAGAMTVTQAREKLTKPKAAPSAEPRRAPPANAVRRADPLPSGKTGPTSYPHHAAIKNAPYEFISITTKGVAGPMPIELVLWDTRGAHEARYVRADRVAAYVTDEDEPATVTEAAPAADAATRAQFGPVDGDPLAIPPGFQRRKKKA